MRDHLGLRGPALVVAAACASGNVAFLQGRTWLHQGWVDAVLVGAGDLWLTPLALACFGNMRVLSEPGGGTVVRLNFPGIIPTADSAPPAGAP